MTKLITVAFVSSAYNEAQNLELLYQRCKDAYLKVVCEYDLSVNFEFHFIVADNASDDDSIAVMQRLCLKDPRITLLINHKNYGPEASVANALKIAELNDIIILLSSDLQDPPELATMMIKKLMLQDSLDSVMAIKTNSSGNSLLRIARSSYYKMLGYSTRLQKVPRGFHGFGCYRREVITDVLRYWDKTDLNLRQCIANSCRSPMEIGYKQSARVNGNSSYKGLSYCAEAIRSLAAGDASASRLSLVISASSMLIGIVASVLILLNLGSGNSGYSGGIPTVMALQILMIGLLSRQIEALRMGGLRPKVFYRLIGSSTYSRHYQEISCHEPTKS